MFSVDVGKFCLSWAAFLAVSGRFARPGRCFWRIKRVLLAMGGVFGGFGLFCSSWAVSLAIFELFARAVFLADVFAWKVRWI